ncbi:MAG: hypothetical protein GY811_15750 [Myxococcales bacterium]|nr:hypothetical protein [Myxococcales bacterium]
MTQLRRTRITGGLCILCALCLTACYGDARDESWDRERVIIGPVAVKSRLAYVDTARDRVVAIETAEGSPKLHSYEIGRNAIFATPTPDRDHLAVVTRGEEALRDGQVDEDPMLWVLDLSEPEGEAQSYEIGSAFDRLAVSTDGSVAVAYFSSGGFDATTGVFRNPNELAIIDLLSEPSDDNPTLRTVRSFGSAPDGVVLSPPMRIPGAEDQSPRVFACILAENTLTLLDATNPKRREVTIRLGTGSEDAGSAIRPRELVFAPNTGTAYLRSDNATDVLSVLLNGEAQESELDNDYQPALAELGAGSGPADVAVWDDAIGRRFVLAAMPGSREVAVIDADTASFVTVSTPDPIDRIMLFPSDPNLQPRVALLASISQGLPRVHLLALDGISDSLVPVDLRTVSMTAPVLDVLQVPGSEQALIVHDATRTVLGLLDLTLGAVSPLEGVGRLDSFDFSADGNFLIGVTSQVSRVGVLDLQSLHPSNIRIDDDPGRVFALEGGAVVVDHSDAFGRATYIPAVDSERSDARVLSGFLLENYLDEED